MDFSFNTSKIFKIMFLSCAGLSLIASFAIIYTNKNQNSVSLSVYSDRHHKNNRYRNTKLLQSLPNKIKSKRENNNLHPYVDLTILGHQDRHILNGKHKGGSENNLDSLIRIPRQGTIRGAVQKSRKNRDFFAFYKVPYAQPPVGKLRFSLPEKPKSWRGIRDGTKKGPICLQRAKNASETTIGSEDCLHLNIYTSKLPRNKTRKQINQDLQFPVLLYIHGDIPQGNGVRYGAQYFMDEDVVLITISYRIGILGSFTKGTIDFPGNLDSRDQVHALKWIQENIHVFGGDPKRVLIFGNSSGGTFVHAHLISPMSKGLFHRAIIQSGNCIRADQFIPEPLVRTREFISDFQCSSNITFKETMKCLRALDASTIALNRVQMVMAGFTVEDQDDQVENKFMPQKPWDMVAQGKVANNYVPVIIGANFWEYFHDGVYNELLLNDTANKLFNENFDEILPSLVKIPKSTDLGRKFRQVYFGSNNISEETRDQLWDLASDFSLHSSRVAGMTLTNSTKQPVYFYWLTKEPPRSHGEDTKKLFPPPYGVAHADELQYLFPHEGYPEISLDSPWFTISENMVKIWVSFARDGKPNIQNLPGNKDNVQWDPISLEDNGMKWLQLDDEIKYVQPFTKRMELWDEYIDVLYGYL